VLLADYIVREQSKVWKHPVFSSDFSKNNDAIGGRMTDMTTFAKNCKSTVVPGLRYRNAVGMIEGLLARKYTPERRNP
jgi:hypothetical protein